MEYERIEKVQTGIISPTKLRLKLMGLPHSRKKDGSNSNSSRTSPSRLQVEDVEFAKNSLLASKNDFEDEALNTDVELENPLGDSKETLPEPNVETGGVKTQQLTKGGLSSVHPLRPHEDEIVDYDSKNASSSTFEFQRWQRSDHDPIFRQFSRPVPSKWNDAEKWIMNRQNTLQTGYAKKNVLYNQGNRMPVRVAPEHANCDHNKTMMMMSGVLGTKSVDLCQPAQTAVEKLGFPPSGTSPFLGQADQSAESKDLREMDHTELSCTTSFPADTTAIRSVCMRDMGTEMTPIPSQEPSRTATPDGAASPLRSSISSIPSTPQRCGAPAPAPAPAPTNMVEENQQNPSEIVREGLSEQELREKTKREILELGVQLGKTNIAAWARKEEQQKNNNSDSVGKISNLEDLERIEFEKHAAMWEEAEKSKHTARYKREEIKIQAWETQQKAKLEAELQRTEAKAEQMRVEAQAKMVRRIAMAKQKSKEKRAMAEARKNIDAEKAAARAEYIRHTGRLPSSNYMCCGWLS